MFNLKLSEKEMLAFIRKKKGISQLQLAKFLGISQSYMSQLETGERYFQENRFKQYKEYIIKYGENQNDAS